MSHLLANVPSICPHLFPLNILGRRESLPKCWNSIDPFFSSPPPSFFLSYFLSQLPSNSNFIALHSNFYSHPFCLLQSMQISYKFHFLPPWRKNKKMWERKNEKCRNFDNFKPFDKREHLISATNAVSQNPSLNFQRHF